LLDLDISAGSVENQAQIKKGWEMFGHIDVLINNAGMSSMKSAEEAE
jgi:NADP-dependent 3-hydroxy acid dehydrogenase YdfG